MQVVDKFMALDGNKKAVDGDFFFFLMHFKSLGSYGEVEMDIKLQRALKFGVSEGSTAQ